MLRKVILLVLALSAVFCGSAYAEKSVLDPLREYYGEETIKSDKFSMTLETGVFEEERGEEDSVYRISGLVSSKLAHTSGKEYLVPVSTLKQLYGKIRFSFDIKVVGDSMGYAARCRQYTNENFSSTATPESFLNIPANVLSDGNWHSLALEFCADGTSGDYVVYLDDMEVPYAEGTSTPCYGLEFIRMQPVCSANSELDFYLDNIIVARHIPVPELLCVNDDDDVPYDATEFYANLDGTLGTVSSENLVLKSIFGEISISSVTVAEDSLYITPAEQLISGTEYTLVLLPDAKTQEGIEIGEAQSITFMTESRSFDISNASLDTENNLKFSGTLINDSEVTARLVVVIYDADGRIQKVEIGDEILSGAIETEIAVSGDYSAKIFCVTSDFQNVIGEKIFTYIGGQI